MPCRNYLMLVFCVFCHAKASLVERIQLNVIGKLNEVNYTSTFKCVATSKPLSCHVDIMVDNSTKDFVRFTGEKCVNRKGKCKPNLCSCSSDCMEFTWSSNENLHSYQIVRFSMKFHAGDSDGGYIKRTAGVVFTGAGYIQEGFLNQTQFGKNDENTTDDKQKKSNIADILIYLCISVSSLGIIFSVIMFKYQNDCSFRRKKDTCYHEVCIDGLNCDFVEGNHSDTDICKDTRFAQKNKF